VCALAACSGSGEPAADVPCVEPTTVADTSRLPRDVPISDYGDLVSVEVEGGFLNARVISDQLIIEIDPDLQRRIIDAGYSVLAHDNEGFEAEIFFGRGGDTTGTIQMREGPCEDQVTIDLLYGSKRYEKESS
jgi:hypothetical protein